MNALLQALWEHLVDTWNAGLRGWNDFWFTPKDPTTLAVLRILTGCILLYVHLTTTPRLLDFIGPNAWVDGQAIEELRTLAYNRDRIPADQEIFHKWHAQSIYFYVQHPAAIFALHGVFLTSLFCFTLGFYTRTATLVAWIFEISYLWRGYILWFGMDVISCMLLLYLLLSPCGATLSLDRFFERLRAARDGLTKKGRLSAILPVQPRWDACLATRLIQLHMCVVYFCAGAAKLQGNMWWDGSAGWLTMNIQEFEVVPMTWLGYAPDWVCELISYVVSLSTILFEIGFPFMVWNRRLRPFMLFLAVMLHVGIGLFMGLGGFAAIMLTGVAAFVYPESMKWFVQALGKGISGFKFTFDRSDAAQVRAAAWIQAADVYEQVEISEAGTAQATASAGTSILPSGQSVQGMEVFGKLWRSLRSLWIVTPLAIWPFFGLKKETLAPASAR